MSQHAPFEAPRLNLPPELLAAVHRHGPGPRSDLHLDGWQGPSLLKRLLNRLFGRSAR